MGVGVERSRISIIEEFKRSKTVVARRWEMETFVLKGTMVRQSVVFKQENKPPMSPGHAFHATNVSMNNDK